LIVSRFSAQCLFTLGNFIRVDQAGKDITGSEWLDQNNGKFSWRKRPFPVIMISGYTRLLDSKNGRFDLVLQKPFEKNRLILFLIERGVIYQRI